MMLLMLFLLLFSLLSSLCLRLLFISLFVVVIALDPVVVSSRHNTVEVRIVSIFAIMSSAFSHYSSWSVMLVNLLLRL